MNQDEVESQLSAMFDGELPPAECELLSRRIDRDESLRARWGRYALIGAAMRTEPVAAAPKGFAARVSAAIEASSRPRRLRRSSAALRGAIAASLVIGVATLGVSMLRTAALSGADSAVAARAAPAPSITLTVAAPAPAVAAAAPFAASPADVLHASPSYVTPAGRNAVTPGLRTELADYIVAHSAYSPPLLRRNVLSELVTGEGQGGMSADQGSFGATPPAGAGSNGIGTGANPGN